MSTTIVWFRQDLRLADNPALTAAAQRGDVLPVYIHAPEEEGDFPPGAATCWWLHQSLAELKPVLRRGPTLATLRTLIQESGADAVYWNRRYEPAAIARDAAIKQALKADAIDARSFNANLLHEPMEIANKSGRPFQVFTPFYRHCLTRPEPAPPLPPPAFASATAESLSLKDLALEPTIDWAAGFRNTWQPGEAGAHRQLQTALAERVIPYPDQRDLPSRPGTSRLSPYLHFGEISPRQIWHAVRHQHKASAEPYLRQIIWREFAHHLLFHFPHTPTQPLRPEFARFPWRKDARFLKAWQRGRTGYPIVDAGMRELWHTGWMHNRVRMIVASYLVKHLRLDWQEGAYWFWDTLVDADLANNTLGWQWSAGCGADAAPYFRIFNPVLQGEKFDPEGVYVRRWVPELAHLPNKFLHQPWNAPTPPNGYPPPLVDHATAREEALSAFQTLRATS